MYQEKFNREEKLPSLKLTIVQYMILAVMLILLSKMWQLEILGANNYRALAEQNRIRKVPILAPRGKLFDRDGRLLVDNYPSISCFLLREPGRDVEADLPLISQGLNIDLDQLHAILRHYRAAPNYQPIPLKQDITPDEQAFIEAHRNELPELETVDEQRRLYPSGGFAAHLIGYVGEVSEEMLNDPRYAYYAPGDVVGKAGVEQTYDQILRGEDGAREVLVDSHGREVGRLHSEHATPGKDLKLTIDIDIQRAAEQVLEGRNGAVVAMDPRTGEILAMASHPNYDPNAFAVRIGRDEWNRLITDPNHPLLNKAIQAQLAPGSTFKIIMATAGLQEGIAQDLHVNCPGGATFYGRYFHCWQKHGHGSVDITKAIWQSCDVFFYTLGEKLGIGKIANWAHRLGMGQKTGIDLPNEVSGVMPSEQWKRKNFHEKWYAGEVISVSIGQGATAATPIQMARAIGGIASGGVLVRPHVVFPDQMPAQYHQAVLDTFNGSGDARVSIDPENWEKVTNAMALVTGPGGTANSGHLEGIDFAGKTGSAQVVGHDSGKNAKDNAWFVGVAPRRNPEIVVCVLVEGGEHGTLAGQLASRVVLAYVNKQRRLDNNLLEAKASKPVEVGAVWSAPPGTEKHKHKEVAQIQGGHYFLLPDGIPALAALIPVAAKR
jgi:penicillin-binding protein 2